MQPIYSIGNGEHMWRLSCPLLALVFIVLYTVSVNLMLVVNLGEGADWSWRHFFIRSCVEKSSLIIITVYEAYHYLFT